MILPKASENETDTQDREHQVVVLESHCRVDHYELDGEERHISSVPNEICREFSDWRSRAKFRVAKMEMLATMRSLERLERSSTETEANSSGARWKKPCQRITNEWYSSVWNSHQRFATVRWLLEPRLGSRGSWHGEWDYADGQKMANHSQFYMTHYSVWPSLLTWLRRIDPSWPGWIDPLARPYGQILFSAHDFFFKFWIHICDQRPQICFMKSTIYPGTAQNRGLFFYMHP